MANIWNATLEPNNDVKQNTFDWTHVNNLTTQIGRITPIQCELVPAKTSFRAKPIPALQLMPMVFPIQTRMRASIAYFRYPLRALWKDYKDFVGNFREGLEEPYHDFNSQSMLDKMLGTGKLMDYLGVPTTITGRYGASVRVDLPNLNNTSRGLPNNITDASESFNTLLDDLIGSQYTIDTLRPGVNPTLPGNASFPPPYFFATAASKYTRDSSFDLNNSVLHFEKNDSSSTNFAQFLNYALLVFFDADGNSSGFIRLSNQTIDQNKLTVTMTSPEKKLMALNESVAFVYHYDTLTVLSNSHTVPFAPLSLTSSVVEEVEGLTLSTSPYYNSNSVNKNKQIKLSAYAARAYEGIYNSVYRDNRNNPYYLDGSVQYNQWIPTYEGGADTYPYELRYANWEKDFLTTSVQSPQQGNAPLVGITTYDQITTVHDDQGNPTLTKQTKVAMVDEDGKRYSLEFESDNDELKGVKYVELDNGTTVRSARSLFDLVTSGISITDLRNVNAYQKFLELNMRKSYSYKDIIEGRFDVKVRYADLLLPEFFGGFSRDINMNAISQTVDQTSTGEGAYKDVLGSQAGVGYFRGGSDANIECFCDEESIIMGLLVITPLPVYTQLLPKHFLYRGLLDHFNPEFNNISFQPITYKEVCPIQAYNDNPDSLTETFGYQRPWYEYCQRYDQAHGLFRTDLSNFLMHRVFDKKPELAQSFLTIDPDQVTDVFSVTDVTDKVYGQILIDCTVKLPVARVAIPRLD